MPLNKQRIKDKCAATDSSSPLCREHFTLNKEKKERIRTSPASHGPNTKALTPILGHPAIMRSRT